MQSWIELSKTALRANLATIKQASNHKPLCICIKGNAYGHGMEYIAETLKNEAAIHFFAVTKIEEAKTLQKLNINQKILILSAVDQDSIAQLPPSNIELTAFSLDYIKALSKHKKQLKIHLKVETGLNRQGIQQQDIPQLIKLLRQNPQLKTIGIMSHLADTDTPQSQYTTSQIKQFNSIALELKKAGIKTTYYHCGNSGSLIAPHPLDQTNLSRVGIMLYGVWPSQALKTKHQSLYHLTPVKSLYTKITQIKTIPPNTPVSYGLKYTSTKTHKIGILPVGYYDGIPRNYPKARVFFPRTQKYAPIIGTICMNHTIINLENIDCKLHEPVEILGHNLLAEEIAQKTDTIPYEILTRTQPQQTTSIPAFSVL